MEGDFSHSLLLKTLTKYLSENLQDIVSWKKYCVSPSGKKSQINLKFLIFRSIRNLSSQSKSMAQNLRKDWFQGERRYELAFLD